LAGPVFCRPDFFSRNYGLDLRTIRPSGAADLLHRKHRQRRRRYLSGWLLRKGWSTNAARKTAMLVFALAVVPIIFAS
jgi:ACS family hexuronate transporter-like MFS transporter